MKSFLNKLWQKYALAAALWLLFEALAVGLWLALDNRFYLFNFSYIGSALALGVALFTQKRPWARNVVQFAIGLYLLVYVGLLGRENMQLEGFCFSAAAGVVMPAGRR